MKNDYQWRNILKTAVFFAVIVQLSFAGLSQAQSLEDTIRWKKLDEEVQRSVDRVEKDCGAKIEVLIDKASFTSAPADFQANTWCDDGPDNIAYLCASVPEAKALVQKKIKKYSCNHGGKGKEAISLKDGIFNYSVDYGASNVRDRMQSVLKKGL
jgi:hypothetical protein